MRARVVAEINPRRTNATLKQSNLNKVERVAEGIQPAVVRRVGRNYARYLKYARSVLTFERERTREALRNLGRAGRTKRGLSIDFLSGVAADYRDLLAMDEPHPVKALGELHQVKISTASRWLSRARELGLIDNEGKEQR